MTPPSSEYCKYVRRSETGVIAVQLRLETSGFSYNKWGGMQTATAGDWIVNNEGDVYTVERETFERSYRQVGPGRYIKDTPVWARIATARGSIKTKEGDTNYEPGDMLVFNDANRCDGYAMTAAAFHRLYVAVT